MTNRDLSQITKPKLSQISTTLDLYICGFPCQPFSNAGKNFGFGDKRGNIFLDCIDTINFLKPKFFILENVKGLLKKKYWNNIYEKLLSTNYNIFYKVLNTKDFGIPQNRERLYIVGILDKQINFSFPTFPTFRKTIPLLDYVDETDNTYYKTSSRQEKILENLKITKPNSVFIEFAFGCSTNRTFINSDKECPCITANTRIWCVPKHRYANVKELSRLQGIKNIDFSHVSVTQAKRQIGNSMSVNVLKYLIKEILKAKIK
jgi:DNA (cytosine-5)-methyltransferase 1